MRNVVFTGTIEPRTRWIWTRESRISLLPWRHLCHHRPPVARNGLKDTEMLPGFPGYSSPGLPDTTSSQQYLLSGTHGIDLCARTCHNPLGEPFEVHGCAGALADRFELCSRYHAFVHHRR